MIITPVNDIRAAFSAYTDTPVGILLKKKKERLGTLQEGNVIPEGIRYSRRNTLFPIASRASLLTCNLCSIIVIKCIELDFYFVILSPLLSANVNTSQVLFESSLRRLS